MFMDFLPSTSGIKLQKTYKYSLWITTLEFRHVCFYFNTSCVPMTLYLLMPKSCKLCAIALAVEHALIAKEVSMTHNPCVPVWSKVRFKTREKFE